MTKNIAKKDVLCLDKVQSLSITRAFYASGIITKGKSVFKKTMINHEKRQGFFKSWGVVSQDETTRVIYSIYVAPTGGIS